MQVLHVSQTQDREAWLQLRLGKVTGKKAKLVKPLSRGKDRTPQGFWTLLAEKIAVASDGEPDLERGHRLENEALQKTAGLFGLNMNLDPGMWVSDDHQDIAISPDAAENTDTPTWAAEAKCLSSANHLKYVIKHMRANKDSEDYKAIDYVPNDAKTAFREQVVQYFVVNEKLQRLYFVLYDDRIVLDRYVLDVIVINRHEIEDEIQAQKTMQLETLKEIEQLITELEEG